MRVACVQSNVAFSNPTVNAEAAIRKLETLKTDGVELAIFPEAFLTGYCVECLEDAAGIAIEKDDVSLGMIRNASDGMGITVVVGFAEVSGSKIYNTAALFEPGEVPRYYRKSHLPELGLDKFVQRGDELQVFDCKFGKLGILICFDLRLPEPTRVLALQGADIIVLPTNWPEGAEVSAEHMAIARSAENRVFFATCDRVGEENGFRFIGLSKIVAPNGQVLAAAGMDEEIITADVDLSQARIKRNAVIPGKYETTVFECRRPEMYEALLEESRVPVA